jgi:uncharacterized membrane protein YfcA
VSSHDLLEALAIFAAGLAAGTINTVVGSGTLITFPTLLAFGYPPVLANVSNNVGLVPGVASGVHGYRAELTGQRKRILRLGSASVCGGLVGAVLLLVLPEGAFKAIVPALIGIALVMVVFQPRLAKWVAARQRARAAARDGSDTVADGSPAVDRSPAVDGSPATGGSPAVDGSRVANVARVPGAGDGPRAVGVAAPGDGGLAVGTAAPGDGARALVTAGTGDVASVLGTAGTGARASAVGVVDAISQPETTLQLGGPVLWVLVFLAGVYGGYFGAAQGVLLIGIMGIAFTETMQRINAVKNVLAGLVNGVAALIFIVATHVDWGVAGLIAAGSIIGGQVGARIGRRLPPWGLRLVIICVGTAALVKLLA